MQGLNFHFPQSSNETIRQVTFGNYRKMGSVSLGCNLNRLGWLNFFLFAFILGVDVNCLVDILRVFFSASENQSVKQPCYEPVYNAVEH